MGLDSTVLVFIVYLDDRRVSLLLLCLYQHSSYFLVVETCAVASPSLKVVGGYCDNFSIPSLVLTESHLALLRRIDSGQSY